MSLNYTPRTDRVIVKRLPKPEPKPGEVIIPGSQQKEPDEGIVMAVGPDVDDLMEGDQVLFLEFAGTPVEIDGEQYLSMREQEVHGIRKDPEAWTTGQIIGVSIMAAVVLFFVVRAIYLILH